MRSWLTKYWTILGSVARAKPGNTKGGSITVLMTSCLTGLESAVQQLTIFVFICKTDKSKPVKQEVSGTVILLPLVFPGQTLAYICLLVCDEGKKFYNVGSSTSFSTTGRNTKLQKLWKLHRKWQKLTTWMYEKSADTQHFIYAYQHITNKLYKNLWTPTKASIHSYDS